MSKPRESAAILRRVAVLAVRDARAAWKKAHASPNESRMRVAFRTSVFAARALRKAAAVSPRDAQQILEEAERVEAASKELLARLARTY